jgi:tetratricopeptide (TPR) repeat protein
MSIPLDQEIRVLRTLFWSDRDPDGRAFVPLADAYRRSGAFRQAVELLNDGLERHPDFASAHAVAARLYLEKGLVEEAEIAARRVLDLDEDNVLGLELLAGALERRGVREEAASVRSHLAQLTGTRAGPSAPAVEQAGDEEEVMDLATLAPDEPPTGEDEVVEVAALAPDERPDEEVMELASLAPDQGTDEDEVMDLAALAPDEAAEEEVFELAALAPDEAAGEEVMELTSLAPDEADEEEVIELAALAPDEAPADEEEVMDLSWLAPEPDVVEEEEVIELAALAPDEAPADEEEVMDLSSLAPEPDVVEEEEPIELAALAPDGAGEPGPGEATPDASDLFPDEPLVELDDLAPTPGWHAPEDEGIVIFASDAGVSSADVLPDDPLPSDEVSDEPHLVTRTMAELYARQGLTDRALGIFRQLLDARPGDPGLRRRVAELEAAEALEPVAAAETEPEEEPAAYAEPYAFLTPSPEEDEGVSGHAWDAEAQQARHEVETPFAWTEQDAEEAPAAGPAIGLYFERLLAWAREDEEDEEDDADEGEPDAVGPTGPDA